MCLARWRSTEGSPLSQCHQAPSRHCCPQRRTSLGRGSVGSPGHLLVAVSQCGGEDAQCLLVQNNVSFVRGCRAAVMKVAKLCELLHLFASPFLPHPSSCSVLAAQPGSGLRLQIKPQLLFLSPPGKEIHPLTEQINR